MTLQIHVFYVFFFWFKVLLPVFSTTGGEFNTVLAQWPFQDTGVDLEAV